MLVRSLAREPGQKQAPASGTEVGAAAALSGIHTTIGAINPLGAHSATDQQGLAAGSRQQSLAGMTGILGDSRVFLAPGKAVADGAPSAPKPGISQYLIRCQANRIGLALSPPSR